MMVPLSIAPGVVSDDTTFLRKGAWSDVDKVRFWRGQPQTIGGWESYQSDLLGGVCRTSFPWTDNSALVNVAFGTHQTLEVAVGGGLYDITPASFVPGLIDGTGGQGYGTGTYSTGLYSAPSTADYFPLTWSLAAYGESLIANPRNQTIYQWNNVTGTPAAPLTNAPANVTYTLVANTRQVMAFGCNEEVSGDFNALCIRFSDVEDPTDWTTSPSNVAGEVILEGGGRIVAARQIGDYINVWTDNALYFGQFTGSTVQPWKFDRVGDHCGLMGPNAAVVVGQRAFWVAPSGQFYTAPMGGEPTLIISPVQVEFTENLTDAQYDKVVAASVSEFNEVWWFYPDQRDNNDTSRYVSLTLDGLWAKGQLPRTSYVDAGPTISPIGVTYGGQIYYHERGTSADGNSLSWFMETADQYIADAQNLVLLRGVWPDFEGQQGSVSLTVKTRLYPQETQRSKGPYALTMAKKRKDFLLQGRIVQMRLSGETSPSFVRLGKINMDIQETGQR